MIPRRFFWLFDFLTISAAFLAAYSFFPSIQYFLSLAIPKWMPSIEMIVAPTCWSGQLPPLLDLLWIFLTITPTSLIVLAVMAIIVSSSGFRDMDALHISMAKEGKADYFITCDDGIVDMARKNQGKLKLSVCSILEFLEKVMNNVKNN